MESGVSLKTHDDYKSRVQQLSYCIVYPPPSHPHCLASLGYDQFFMRYEHRNLFSKYIPQVKLTGQRIYLYEVVL